MQNMHAGDSLKFRLIKIITGILKVLGTSVKFLSPIEE